MSLNDTSVHPTGALGVEYAGVMNPSASSTYRPDDALASEGDLSGHVQPGASATTNDDGNAPGGILSGHVPPAGQETGRDVIEGEPGVIESSELAPLGGDDKVAADPSLVSRATGAAKQALRSAGADV